MCTRLAFLKFCAGLNVEGRMIFEVSGFVKLLSSEQKAEDARERTAVAIANGHILKVARSTQGRRPAEENIGP